MKILLAPAHYMLDGVIGGSEFSWAYNIIRSLAAYPDVEIIAITGLVKPSTSFPPNVRIITLDRSPTLNLTWAYRLRFVFKYFIAARRELKSESIDVVHHVLPFGLSSTFNLLPLLGTVRRTPFVIGPLQAPHTFATDEEFVIYSQGKFEKYAGLKDMLHDKLGLLTARAARRTLASLSLATLRRSDALIAVNEETGAMYARAVPGVCTRVISPGIHVDAFQQTGSGVERTGREIITVGSLIKRKGIDLIIKAMAELKVTHPQVRLRIVGDGPQRESLESLARRLGVDDIVVFQGFVPNKEIAALYEASDVYVSMSFSESFGQTLVEAMAVGLCVVAAENVGSRGIIEDGRTGFLVRSGDVSHLVETLRAVFDQADRRVGIGSEARRAAKECFDWTEIAAKYMALYEALRQPSI